MPSMCRRATRKGLRCALEPRFRNHNPRVDGTLSRRGMSGTLQNPKSRRHRCLLAALWMLFRLRFFRRLGHWVLFRLRFFRHLQRPLLFRLGLFRHLRQLLWSHLLLFRRLRQRLAVSVLASRLVSRVGQSRQTEVMMQSLTRSGSYILRA